MPKAGRKLMLVVGALVLLSVPAVAEAARRQSVTREPPQTTTQTRAAAFSWPTALEASTWAG